MSYHHELPQGNRPKHCVQCWPPTASVQYQISHIHIDLKKKKNQISKWYYKKWKILTESSMMEDGSK